MCSHGVHFTPEGAHPPGPFLATSGDRRPQLARPRNRPPGCEGSLPMTDLLLSAAKRLGVPTETSVGPGGGPVTFSIWARWPRHPYEIAQDVLNAVIRTEVDASVTPVGGTPLWRARHGRWTHI